MQKSNLPQGVRTLEKWYTTNTLKFDFAYSRERLDSGVHFRNLC